LAVADPRETPFDNVENAQEYVRLLVDAVIEAKQDIAADIATATESKLDRRVEALRLVQHKLDKLEQHLKTSGRLLKDLRTLRRLLLDERTMPAASDEGRPPKR
jgi:hypothetical protein